ncbi:MAG: tRNA pseudouridine(13) synthase TruD [Halioglobus sp.]
MELSWPRAWGEPQASAVIRARPEDFVVHELLGFELSGEGEHVFLHLEKRELNTVELQERIARLSGVPARDVGFSGMKDRNAVTRQWFSVGLAGKPVPDWSELELPGDVGVLEVKRHSRKLKRGVHKANRFQLRLSALQCERAELESRLQRVAVEGVPNYFGEQRFGRGGQTLVQAQQWMGAGRRKLTRNKRSLYLSALRSWVFNDLLAHRVGQQSWNRVAVGEVCMLQGTRSRFCYEAGEEGVLSRCHRGDIHPGLPLWGKGRAEASPAVVSEQQTLLEGHLATCEFLEREGLSLDYRSARLMADDFCWQFCDDGSLLLEFSLGPGGYATAVLAELVHYKKGERGSGNGSE